MTIRRSTKLVNDLANGYGVKELLRDGVINVYSGTQPTDADISPAGTLLLTYTAGGNTFVDAVRSVASIAIGGTTGTLATITVGGMDFNLLSEAVAYNSTAALTVTDIVTNINAKQNPLNIVAVQNTSTVELYAPYWLGAESNNLTFATSVTAGLTATSSGIFDSGTNAVNGINFAETVTDGVIGKTSDVWQANGIVDGTAAWFRFVPCGSATDGDGANYGRFDGSVGTSNADMIISTTAIITGAVYTISAGTITEPKE